MKPSQRVVCSKNDPRSGLGERQLSGPLGEVGLGLVGAGGGDNVSVSGRLRACGRGGQRGLGRAGSQCAGLHRWLSLPSIKIQI